MNQTDSAVKEYIIGIIAEAETKASAFPVDREFLENYIKEIKNIDSCQFVFCCFDLSNDLITEVLFLCLPEVWEDLTLNDLLTMCNRFNNELSFYSLIKFTYKYLEIDIIELVLDTCRVKTSPQLRRSILDFLLLQYNTFINDQIDINLDEQLFGFNYNAWLYLKQKFLLDERVKPASPNVLELASHISQICNKYRN